MTTRAQSVYAPAPTPTATPKLDPREARRITELLEETDLDGPLMRLNAAISEMGVRRDYSRPSGPPGDIHWELFRPDESDLARFGGWQANPGELVGRVQYWDSRRGQLLTLDQIELGLCDLVFDPRQFSPEAFSVFMLRWIETQLRYAELCGIDLDAEAEMGTPLGTIRKYAWMAEGLSGA